MSARLDRPAPGDDERGSGARDRRGRPGCGRVRRFVYEGIFAIDLVEELSALGALEEGERGRREAVVLLERWRPASPERSLEKSGRRCRIGAMLFVVGVRRPTRGGAKVKEPRS